ncbi:MAG TPA: pyruvate formate lyase family protein [Armatimonadota bacterium]|nr:pyruvate formate lyase family protein [Armatimonadota bacterium]
MATALNQSGRLSEASEHLKQTVLAEAGPFWERDLLAAASFRETEGEPCRQVRVAKATAHILAHMPVRIREGELLAGWHPSTPLTEETKRARTEAVQYLSRHNAFAFGSEGHLAPDYPKILRVGLEGIRREFEERQRAVDPTHPAGAGQQVFYQAAGISLEALQGLIRRYGERALEMAATAADSGWAEGLRHIAEACDYIATAPPRTLREAIQLVWFVWMAIAIENGVGHTCFGPGRMDQYLYPFYLAERTAGTLDEALLQELLDQFFIKTNEFDGREMSAVIIGVAGRKPDDSDATNELSYLMLETADRVQMYFPGIDIAWHQDLAPDFKRAAVRLLRNGKGQPSVFNDAIIIKGLMRYGVPFEEAVDHLPSTCTETSIAGRCNPWVACPYVSLPLALNRALFGSRPPEKWEPGAADGLPQTYDEFKHAVHREIASMAKEAVASGLRQQMLESWHRPFPLLSCFIQGCLEGGKDISHGGARYNFLQPEAVGTTNVVDGMAAVQLLVAEQARYRLDDFRQAVRDNWEGHDELRRAVLGECPKHGNDVPWINDLFAEVAGAWCSAIEGRKNYYGGPVFPGFLGWVVWYDQGDAVPATPDGRRKGEPMANSIGPATGVKPKGIPAMMLSLSKFDHSRGLGGMVTNVRLQANALRDEAGVERLVGLIEACMEMGIYHMQFDLASSEKLRDAQAHPDNYSDLFVRIGGYLVPFTLLPPPVQEEVIARADMGL